MASPPNAVERSLAPPHDDPRFEGARVVRTHVEFDTSLVDAGAGPVYADSRLGVGHPLDANDDGQSLTPCKSSGPRAPVCEKSLNFDLRREVGYP